VPTPVDTTFFTNPIGHAVVEFFKPVPATQLHVFVSGGFPSEAHNKGVNDAARLRWWEEKSTNML